MTNSGHLFSAARVAIVSLSLALCGTSTLLARGGGGNGGGGHNGQGHNSSSKSPGFVNTIHPIIVGRGNSDHHSSRSERRIERKLARLERKEKRLQEKLHREKSNPTQTSKPIERGDPKPPGGTQTGTNTPTNPPSAPPSAPPATVPPPRTGTPVQSPTPPAPGSTPGGGGRELLGGAATHKQD